MKIIRIKNLTREKIENLTYSEDIRDRVEAAINATQEDILSHLANDRRAEVRVEVAGNSDTPQGVLYDLAIDKSYKVRASVANNSNINESIMYRLSTAKEEFIRSNIAYKTSSPKVLEKLSNDEDPQVRVYVASNHNTPIKILEKLSSDEFKSVRTTVASNPFFPEELRGKIEL